MQKNKFTELIVTLAYIVLVVVIRSVYLYFGKGLNVFRAIQTVMLEFGIFLIGMVFVSIASIFVLMISNTFFRKR